MSTLSYHHYSPFTRRYLNAVKKQLGLPKNAPLDYEVMRHVLEDPAILSSINADIFMLEQFHAKAGHVIIPSAAISDKVSKDQFTSANPPSWQWPAKVTTVSVPNGQTFGSHKIDGILVGWMKSSEISRQMNKMLRHYNIDEWYEPVEKEGHRLTIAINSPIDEDPINHPCMLRSAFTTSEIGDFINNDVMLPTEHGADPLIAEEHEILREVSNYIVSLGSYITSRPEMVKAGKPTWLKNSIRNQRGVKILAIEG